MKLVVWALRQTTHVIEDDVSSNEARRELNSVRERRSLEAESSILTFVNLQGAEEGHDLRRLD